MKRIGVLLLAIALFSTLVGCKEEPYYTFPDDTNYSTDQMNC